MSTYTPDCWELLRITTTNGKVIYKVIAGWYGGFSGSNSWKISSGIESVIEHEHYFEMPQSSGSVYNCGKSTRRMSGLMSSIYASFVDQLKESGSATLELIVDEPTTLTLTKEE